MNGATWLIVGALAWAYLRKQSDIKAAMNQWREQVPINGTDFQGAIWDRLDGTDLLNARWQDQNLANSNTADPGKVGAAQLGLQPSWNGGL
jgi:hypothetical protein